MRRLLIVSNRLPVIVEKRRKKFHLQPSVGGLATGLGSFYQSYNSVWIGWPGIASERIEDGEAGDLTERLWEEFRCKPVFLSQREVEAFYHGFCNHTLWPLFHYFTQHAFYRREHFEFYKRVNAAFCKAVLEEVQEGDIIWIHDYHLMLLPKLLREEVPRATIGFFLHIPFPSFEIFRLLPWRKELLEGLMGADLLGFHTYDYARHFLASVRRLLGYEHTLGTLQTEDRVVRVDAFPMGIDYERFAQAADDPKVKREVARLQGRLGPRQVILSIDRLDYTKGILQRIEAFARFLGKRPEYREKVTLILVAVPSRTQVEHYRLLKREVDELVGRVNGEYGTIGWNPIWYLYRLLHFPVLNALYRLADVALVTPLRDGMNLIAKEYLASRVDGTGVLILSEMAGAATELGEALLVNPNNEDELIEALERALTMPIEEQVERNRAMQRRLRRYTVKRWAKDFLDSLDKVKALSRERETKLLTPALRAKLLEDYRGAKRRLLFLDYDGTLVPFSSRPEMAAPPPELLEVLRKLGVQRGNEVVIISGRDRGTLERWFGSLPVSLVAEHGAWIKEGEWQAALPLEDSWKEEIRPILEFYTDRTPGSFIEEKDFSLVWHYRRADPELAEIRARELKDELLTLTANLNLGVLEGSKVLEVKDTSINKGRAALRWLEESWDFIFAVGDDWTDEDIFAVLPQWAYSIRVGLSPSQARFNILSHTQVRELLEELVRCDEGADETL
ncbi:MAG: bifunctional alpha,alpha-trehalose-phosphate synthase (UDP-forming)/trehalose-phosphatase [Deltaproteobacteria bacterium]|nr:MAG: bifunctional alpha,alpha-trehalose-phosphate synthase (UDP-forming)/trehalose-phosphatase [Deltaproteobacteria bacterium]HEX15863.1 bifunctional alpha,alpha-trehalose-phosphate synthase (UDP-forming)/trehalose-phosphatase [Deltaproteobacteria bacterium]